MRCLDLHEAGIGIDERHRTARGPHQSNGFAQNQPQRLLRIEGGMNDIADFVQQAEARIAFLKLGQFVAHREKFKG